MVSGSIDNGDSIRDLPYLRRRKWEPPEDFVRRGMTIAERNLN